MSKQKENTAELTMNLHDKAEEIQKMAFALCRKLMSESYDSLHAQLEDMKKVGQLAERAIKIREAANELRDHDREVKA